MQTKYTMWLFQVIMCNHNGERREDIPTQHVLASSVGQALAVVREWGDGVKVERLWEVPIPPGTYIGH